jgi:preprotein translocase subunit SecF
MVNFIKYRSLFFWISGILIAASITAVLIFGFRLGIDFTSGSLWQLKIPATNANAVNTFFTSTLHVETANVSYDPQSQTYSVTSKEITDQSRQQYLEELKQHFGDGVENVDFWNVSPAVSQELKRNAIIAIILVLFGISLYVAFAFRKVSRPVSSWKYGFITLLTLAHDVIIPAGLYAVLGKYLGVAADTNFMVALLVVMGFSVHDTIVVFDRIRENLIIYRGKEDFSGIVNRSVNETLRRSVSTSFALILVLIALFFMGPSSLKFFVLTILVGTLVGTYSSIFIASPLLVVWQKLSERKRV